MLAGFSISKLQCPKTHVNVGRAGSLQIFNNTVFFKY